MYKNQYTGKFIAFEGLDGAGSTTQAEKLTRYLKKRGEKVHLTKEPTNNLIGGMIRGQLTKEWRTGPECLQLLFTADRAHHLEKEVIPLLKQGVTVITDRYFFSSVAFGSLGIADREWLQKINDRFILPDITFMLNVSPRICLQRINESRFHLELFEEEENMEKIWRTYATLAQDFEDVYVINGEKTVEEVFTDITKIVNEFL
ncbi:putative thymidylate kinase [ANME-1 cluster archaeon GoMg2]|nr:putative thymidylate kinase [ANME-1 cluster archaeon GoMg2]